MNVRARGIAALKSSSALICVAAVLVPVFSVLAWRVPNLREVPLVAEGLSRDAAAIELRYADMPSRRGHHVAEAILRLPRLETLTAHERVDFLVATFNTRFDLESAELFVDGTNCAYRARRGTTFPNNGHLELWRDGTCTRMSGTPNGLLRFTIRFSGQGKAGLWTYQVDPAAVERTTLFVADQSRGIVGEVRGRYVDDYGLSHLRRADLLADTWSMDVRTFWKWWTVAAGLLCAGALLLFPKPGAPGTMQVSAAAFALCGGIALLYALLFPPFQAPDEPSHFLGYGYVTENPRIAEGAAEWARATHFQRIRFFPGEHFRPADVGQRDARAWDLVYTQDFARSSVTIRLWRALAPRLRTFTVERQLLLLRVVNCLILALAAALCAAAMRLTGGGAPALTLTAFWLMIPTVPFFGMHVSNYAAATAAYLVLATGVSMLVLDGPRSAVAGWFIGPGAALAIAATRSAVPLLLLVIVCCMARVVLGSAARGDRRSRIVDAAIFWFGIGFGAITFTGLVTEWQQLRLTKDLTELNQTVGAVYGWLSAHLVVALVIAVVAAVALEGAGSSARAAAAVVTRAARVGSIGGAIFVCGTLVASLFVSLPVLQPATPGGTTPRAYAMQAMSSFATIFRVRDHDFLLSTSFWAGLGWLDTIPPFVTTLLATATGAATIAALMVARGALNVRRIAWLLVIAMGATATVGLYAVVVLRLAPDVHGRYLMGAYLCLFSAVWIAAVGPDGERGPRRAIPGLVGALGALSNAAALTWALLRYF